MRLNDAIAGALLLALALVILFHVQSFPKIPGQNVGPAAFPGTLAALLAVCALVLIVRGWRERAAQPWLVPGAWLRMPMPRRRLAVAVGVLLFYIGASDRLGFIPTGILCLSAMFAVLGVRTRWVLPLSVVTTLLIHTVFYKGLRVPLPWGVLQPWLW